MIGDNRKIYGNVTVFRARESGRGVTIFPGAVISGIPRISNFRGEETFVYIGDGTILRECTTVKPRNRL